MNIQQPHSSHPSPYARATFWVFLSVAAFYLILEHRAHLLGWLPYLLLLLCPIMHVFMHRSHRHHEHDERSEGHEGGSSNDTHTHHQQ